MTKGDLVQLLEPFEDDIPIFVLPDGSPNMDLRSLQRATYRVRARHPLITVEGLIIDSGEGYIELKVNS